MLRVTTATRLVRSTPVERRATASAIQPAPTSPTPTTLQAQQDAIKAAPTSALPTAGTTSTSPTLLSAMQTAPLVEAQQGTMLTQQDVLVSRQISGSLGAATTEPTGPSQEEIIASITSVSSRDRLARAIDHAHQLWRLQAHFQNIVINSVAAIGTPGCLDGPDLRPLIRTYPEIASVDGLELELCEAVAEGVSSCFSAWQSGVTVPGLPWYPAFAAFPGPTAPPMPNVPVPVITCVSASLSKITSSLELEQAMVAALPNTLRVPETEAMMRSLGQTLALKFMVWVASQMVMLVMGTGPVPAFAPPYVPVGSVIGGWIIASPGHLSA